MEKFFRRMVGLLVLHPALTLTTALLLALSGLFYGLPKLRFEPLPDFAALQLQIVGMSPGKNAEDIDREITRPLGTLLAEGRPKGIVRMQGSSQQGVSQILVFVSSQGEMQNALGFLRSRLEEFSARADFPAGYGKPRLLPSTTPLAGLLEFQLRGKEGLHPSSLSFVLKTQIIPKLLAVPGVYSVVPYGGGERVFEIQVDPEKILVDSGVSIDEIAQTISASSQRVGQGREFGGELSSLESVLRGDEDAIRKGLSDLSVSPGISLGAVADHIQPQYSQRHAFACDASGEIILVRVYRSPDADSWKTAQAVSEKLQSISQTLPDELRIEILWEKLEAAERELYPLLLSVGIGWIAVIATVYLIFGNFRLSLVAFLVMPFALLVGASVLALQGQLSDTKLLISLIVIGAIDFGFCVDSSLSVLDYIEKELRGAKYTSVRAVIKGTLRARMAAVVAELAVIASMEAIRWLPGRSGEMFGPVVTVLQVLLLTSSLASFTIVPTLAFLFVRTRGTTEVESSTVGISQVESLTEFLGKVSGRALLVAHFSVIAFAAIVFLATPWESLPQLDEGALLVHLKQLPAEGEVQAQKNVSLVCQSLQELPEIRHAYASSGASEDDPMLATEADIRLLLWPRHRWRKGMTRAELEARLMSLLKKRHPSILATVSQPIEFRITELSGFRADVVVSLTSTKLDYTELMDRGVLLSRKLANLVGAQTVVTQPQGMISEKVIAINPSAALELGLDTSKLQQLGELRFGKPCGIAIEDGFPVPITLKLNPHSLGADGISNLAMKSAKNEVVSLANVMHLSSRQVPSKILRVDGAAQVVVLISRVQGMSLSGIAREVRKEIAASEALLDNVQVDYGGRFVDERDVIYQMLMGFLLSTALVLAFIFVTLRSGSLAMLSVLVMLSAAAVSTFVLIRLGRSGAGVLGMTVGVGLAAMFYIMWASAAERLRKALPISERRNASKLTTVATEATRERFRAILGTAFATSSGYLGVLLSAFGVFGHPEHAAIARPFAITVTITVIAMALYTVIVVPRLYVLAQSSKGKG